MFPPKKEKVQRPATVTPAIEDESSDCSECEESSCPKPSSLDDESTRC